jgi:hypothetical protein
MRPVSSKLPLAFLLGLSACFCGSALGQTAPSLEQGFQNPPSSAHPRVWWHWMNGNITKEGIDLDLDWMHRIGIAGFQNFDAALNTPKVVDKRLVYMTPEWKDAFHHAIIKGDSLGFEMAVAGSPGWSESGGPWVKPSQAMKKVVWSETHIEGGQPFTGSLPPVPSQTGPFGNLAQPDLMGAVLGGKATVVQDFSADAAVVAFRDPESYSSAAQLSALISSNGGAVANSSFLWSGDLNQAVSIPVAAVGQKAWLQYDLGKSVTVRAVTFALGGPGNPLSLFGTETNDGPVVESSDDGVAFLPIVRMPTFGAVQHTMSFPPRTARYFRLSFLEATPAGPLLGIDPDALGMAAPAPPTTHQIAEFELHTEARVNRFEEKAAYFPAPDLYGFATAQTESGSTIKKTDVINLTSKMKPDGTLDWTPPPGHWTVLRMGYSLTGITNHPAPPEATGPEVDKLNRDDVKAYLDQYLDNYKDATGGMMGKRGVKYVITDSWEAGTQNWTNNMVAEFTRRRGYDPVPWLPVMTGRIIGSAQESDRFLWDLRKTIADLLAENHYGTIAETLHARGMGQYGESHEAGRATIGDGMEMKRNDDVPMSAMWTQQPGVNTEQYGFNADIRESASVAHIYGQNLVAAESLTAASNSWGWSPATLKPTADKELAMGLNRFVIHSSVHQPLIDKAPGLTLGPFGQWFNRNENWAEQAEPWITYLSRSAFMLQQGRFIADIVYFYGEDSNLTAIFASKSPDVPRGYNFDYINADALIHKLNVDKGDLTTASGMRYRVLVLDPYSRHMSLPVLKRLEQLAKDGATIIGEAPTDTPSLGDDATQFHSIVEKMWAGNTYGKGRLIYGMSVSDAIVKAGLTPDFDYKRPQPDSDVLFVHRRADNKDIFYIDNRNDRAQTITADFRTAGRSVTLWHADTGKTEEVSYASAGGRTSVPLKLTPYETVFVVFGKSGASSHTVPVKQEVSLTSFNGPWSVRFEAGRGATAEIEMPSLSSLSESKDSGIRYFAGHATYIKTIEAPASWFHPGAELWLDLGDVANLAEVKINGVPLGIVWKAPYRVDVSKAFKPGANQVEIRVADLWVNRLIGDAQPDAPKQYTFTAHNPYKASSKLVPSGLLGPVTIIRKSRGTS